MGHPVVRGQGRDGSLRPPPIQSVLGKGANAQLRSLQIEQDANRPAGVALNGTNEVEPPPVILVRAVAEVELENIRAGTEQGFDGFAVGWPAPGWQQSWRCGCGACQFLLAASSVMGHGHVGSAHVVSPEKRRARPYPRPPSSTAACGQRSEGSPLEPTGTANHHRSRME